MIAQYLRETDLASVAALLEQHVGASGDTLAAAESMPRAHLNTLLQLAMRQAHDVPSAPAEQAAVQKAAEALGPQPCEASLFEGKWRDSITYMDVQFALSEARKTVQLAPTAVALVVPAAALVVPV